MTCPSLSSSSSNNGGYGVNWYHVIQYPPDAGFANVGLGDIKAPSETMVLADSSNVGYLGATTETFGFSAIYCIIDYPTSAYSLANNGISVRHNGGANVLLLDGHAKWYQTSTLVNPTNKAVWGHP